MNNGFLSTLAAVITSTFMRSGRKAAAITIMEMMEKAHGKLPLMSDSHTSYLPGFKIAKYPEVAVWIGDKNKIPKGWKKISEKEALKIINKLPNKHSKTAQEIEGWLWAKYFSDFCEKISHEASPHYEDEDNEMYTIVSFEVDRMKFSKRTAELGINDLLCAEKGKEEKNNGK